MEKDKALTVEDVLHKDTVRIIAIRKIVEVCLEQQTNEEVKQRLTSFLVDIDASIDGTYEPGETE